MGIANKCHGIKHCVKETGFQNVKSRIRIILDYFARAELEYLCLLRLKLSLFLNTSFVHLFLRNLTVSLLSFAVHPDNVELTQQCL